MNKNQNWRRILTLICVMAMLVGILVVGSVVAFAADGEGEPVAQSNVVAKVGSIEYTTIDEAIANWTNGSTLTLLADVTLSDVIKLSSTEHHILDLGTHTMTAASKKDAIEIVNNGRTSASYTLDIKADATNPGGITASGKAVVKTTGKSGVKDRPIIRFYNGVFDASNIVSHSGSNGTNCPQFQFHGGVYNGNFSTNRALMQFYGGTFNGKFYMSVDSSAYALISGGKFKHLDNLYGSALNSDKFTIGSSKGNFDRGVYVDEEGYIVVGGPVIEKVSAEYVAVASNASKAGSYLPYSSAATYGLFYKDAAMAIAKHGEANVKVWVKPLVNVTVSENVTGDTTVIEEIKSSTVLDGYKPQNLPTDAVLNIELESVGDKIVYDVTPVNDAGEKVETTEAITFLLPVPAGVTHAKVYHDGTLMGIYAVQGEGNAKYVEVSSADFSKFAVEPVTVVAKVGDTLYTTIQAAINAAQNGETVTILPGEYSGFNISNKNITIKGTVGDNGELLTTIKGGNPAITGHGFNGTIKDLKIVDAFKVMYAEPAGNVTVDNVYVTGATYGFHFVAYAQGLTWTIQNSYMDLSWANSFGVYGDGDAAIVIKNNEFASTSPYYPDYGALAVNTFLPNVTVTGNVFGENTKIYIDDSVTDTSKVNIYKNYHADGVENAFAVDEDGGKTVDIYEYYTEVNENGFSGLVDTRVAKIGDVKYATLQAAINAVQNGETITLLDNVAEDVTLTEKTGLYYTIDGNGKNFNGTMTIRSLSDTNDNRRITIKNINFVDNTDANVDFISSTATNHYPRLTVEGCTFKGNGGDVAIRLKSADSVVIKDCTGTGLHSFLQNTAGWNLTIENVKVTDSKGGLALGTVQGVTVKGCNIDVAGYGIRLDAGYNNNAVIESNTVKAFIPVVVRKASVNSNITVQGTNTFTASNTDGIWFAIGTSEYETNGTMPTAATAKVIVTLNDNGLSAAGVYGNYGVAEVNGVKYTTLEAAAAAAQAGDTITLLDDVTLSAELTLPADITLNGNGKQINGTIYAGGNLTFAGHTKVTAFSASYYDRVITIGAGACLEITGTGRVSLAYGNVFNITGNITDAKTADKANVQPSLIIPGGISITGGRDAALNVTNAYVKIGSTTTKNSAANGTFTLNFNNSIVEFTNQLTIAEPTSGMNPTIEINVKDSVLTTGTKFVLAAPNSTVVVDNSVVTLDTYFRNSGSFTLQNGSVLTGSTIQFGENGGNNGIITVDNSTLTINASAIGHALDGKGTGQIVLKNGATATVTYFKDMEVVLSAGTELTSSTADGNVTAVTGYKAEYADGKYTAVKLPVAKIGETYYATLEDAFKAATSGCTIEILQDVTIDYYWDARNTGAKFTVPVTIDGNGHTIKFTSTVYDGGNYMSAFRFEADATVVDLTIDMSEAISGFAGRFRAISAKANLTVDGCTFIGNGSANNTRAIIFGEGATSIQTISITDSTFTGWRRAISDNESGHDVAANVTITGNEITDASVYVSATTSITFTGNTVEDGLVDLRTCDKNNLSVVANDNTLDTEFVNVIKAKTVNAQPEFVTTVYVSTKAELNAALAAAKDGDTILLIADIDYGTDQLAINAAITLDLGGKTLTTRNAYGGMSVKGNPTIKNGTIVHASNTAAIKVWNATAFEDLVIDVQGKGDANKTIGGIVLQSGSTTRVGSIKNVTIKGAALTNGIETYNCGDATENVIGSLENVTINAVGTGMLISAPVGTATNCNIKGGTNAIEIFIKGNYSASLDLVNSKVEGGVYAHDEFSSNPDIVNNGTLNLTVSGTTNVDADDITLTLARAENVAGLIEEVKDNAQAKVNDTYYATLADAMTAAKAGDVVTVFAGTYAMPSMKAGITIVGEGEVVFEGTLTGTLENLTLKNIHIKGGNAQRWAYAKGDLVFENVTFEATSVYALHFDGITEGATLTYTDCTIIGWAAMSGSPASATFEGCTFKGNGTYGVIRVYFDATIENCTFDVANVNTNDSYEDGIHAVSGAVVTVENCTNANGTMLNLVNVGGTSVVVLDDVVIKNVAKIGDKYYATLADAFAAAQNGDEVEILVAGTYALSTSGKDITVTGNVDGVVFDNIGAKNMGGANVTFNNVTFDYYPNVNYTGLQHSGNLVYNNCTFNGQVFLYGTSETFNNCTFNQNSADAYNVWTYGAKEVAFNGCTFNSAGKSVLIYHESASVSNNVTVANCTFNASQAVEGKAAIEMDSSLSGAINLTITDTTATGFGNGNVSGNSLWNNKKGNNTDANNDITVVVDDVTVLAPVTFVAKIGNVGYTSIADAIAAAKAGDVVTVFAGTYAMPSMKAGITIVGEGDVMFEGTLTGTLENLTLKNIHIKGGNAQRWAYAKGDLVFENVTFEATSVYALHFDGITEGATLTYTDCTIIGWAAMSGSPASATFEGCTFKGNGTYGVIRVYFDATIENCTFDVANVNTNDSYEDGIHAVSGAVVTVENCTNANGTMLNLVNVGGTSVVVLDDVVIKNVAKIGDKYYATLADAFAAAQNGDEVEILVAGTYALSTSGKDITVTGNVDGVVFDNIGAKNMGGANVTFNNVTFDYYPNVNYTGLQHSGNLVYNNCTFNGQVFLYGTSETFNNCTFNQNSADAYNVWTYGAKEVAFNGCTFNSAGKSVLIYHESASVSNNVTVANCTFNASQAVEGKAAIEMDSSLSGAINLTITDTTATGFGNGNVSGNSLWNNKKGNNTDANNDITVVVDDVTVLAPVTFVAKIGNVGYTSIADAIAAAQDGETITLLAPIVVNAGEELVIDLKGVTISYVSNVVGEDMITNYGKLTINDSIGGGKIVYINTDTTGSNVTVSTITNAPGAELVINGGTIENASVYNSNSIYPFAIDNVTNGTLGTAKTTINGGTIKSNYRSVRLFANSTSDRNTVNINGGEFIGQVWLQASSAAAHKVTLIISGGKFAPAGNDASSVFVTTLGATKPTFRVTGGYFTTKIGTDNATLACNYGIAGGTFTAEAMQNTTAGLIRTGYEFFQNEDGTYGVETVKYVSVTDKNGNVTKYEALNKLNNLDLDGCTITLLKDVSGQLSIEGDNVVIDLNGKTWTISGTAVFVENGASLKVVDSANGGKIVATGGVFNVENATLVIESGIFESTNSDVIEANYATVTINGGKLIGADNGVNMIENSASAANTLTINGGEIVAGGYAIATNGTYDYSTITIAGGKLTGTEGSIYHSAEGVLSITNGELNGTLKVLAGNVTVSGGTINGDTTVYYQGASTGYGEITLEITGGTFNGVVTSTAADGLVAKNAFISGGTFSSAVAEEFCAAGYIPVKNADGTFGVKLGKYVAELNGVKYETLEAAINAAAQNGDTITLLADINLGDLTSAIIIKKSITIDGNDHVITINSVNDSWNAGAFAPRGPISYAFKNLTVVLNNAASDMAAFNMKYGGTLENVTVKGAFGQAVSVTMAYTVTVKDCAFEGAKWGVYANASGAEAIVTGTTFNTVGAVYLHQNGELVFTDNIVALNSFIQTNATVDVSKNFWNGNNAEGSAPAATQLKGENFICDNYYATNTNGVLSDLTDNVAEEPVIKIEIDGVVYNYGVSKLPLLAKLLGSNTKATNVTITLLADVELAEGMQLAAYWEYVDEMVITPKNVTIDLNGHTLYGFVQVNANVTATIKNGTIENTNSTYAAVDSIGTVTLDKVTINSAKDVTIHEGGVFNAQAKLDNTYYRTYSDAYKAYNELGGNLVLLTAVKDAYLKLGTTINLCFTVDMAAIYNGLNYVAVITGGGKTFVIDMNSWTPSDDMTYSITFEGLTAKQMSVEFTIEIMLAEQVNNKALTNTITSKAVATSVKSYVENGLKIEDLFDADDIKLLTALLNYGAQAEIYFNQAANGTANNVAGLDTTDEPELSTDDLGNGIKPTDDAGLYYLSSLNAQNNLQFNFKFFAEGLENATKAVITDADDNVIAEFTFNEFYTSTAKVNNEVKDLYVIVVDNIDASYYNVAMTCTFYNANNEEITHVTDSILEYCTRAYNGNKANNNSNAYFFASIIEYGKAVAEYNK